MGRFVVFRVLRFCNEAFYWNEKVGRVLKFSYWKGGFNSKRACVLNGRCSFVWRTCISDGFNWFTLSFEFFFSLKYWILIQMNKKKYEFIILYDIHWKKSYYIKLNGAAVFKWQLWGNEKNVVGSQRGCTSVSSRAPKSFDVADIKNLIRPTASWGCYTWHVRNEKPFGNSTAILSTAYPFDSQTFILVKYTTFKAKRLNRFKKIIYNYTLTTIWS